ncbi:hypothetical protein GEMRC1_001225 [Eukaryota sp. GEM-RC1]
MTTALLGFSSRNSSLESQDRVHQYSKLADTLKTVHKHRCGKHRLLSKSLTSQYPEASLLLNIRKLEHSAEALLSRVRLEQSYPFNYVNASFFPEGTLCTVTFTPSNLICPILQQLYTSNLSDNVLVNSCTLSVSSYRDNRPILSTPISITSSEPQSFEFNSNCKVLRLTIDIEPHLKTSLFSPSPLLSSIMSSIGSLPPPIAVSLPQTLSAVLKYAMTRGCVNDQMKVIAGRDELITQLISPQMAVDSVDLVSFVLAQLKLSTPSAQVMINSNTRLSMDCRFEVSPRLSGDLISNEVEAERPWVDDVIDVAWRRCELLKESVIDPCGSLSNLIGSYSDEMKVLKQFNSPVEERSGEVFRKSPEISTILAQRMSLMNKSQRASK